MYFHSLECTVRRPMAPARAQSHWESQSLVHPPPVAPAGASRFVHSNAPALVIRRSQSPSQSRWRWLPASPQAGLPVTVVLLSLVTLTLFFTGATAHGGQKCKSTIAMLVCMWFRNRTPVRVRMPGTPCLSLTAIPDWVGGTFRMNHCMAFVLLI